MKKLLAILIVILLLVVRVEAAENRLHFEESDGKLYYDTDKFKKEVFMSYQEMRPGKVYTDTLEIKNNSKNSYNLYLRINGVEQDVLGDELVDNLKMEIYVDDKLVYEGEARGLEYDENGVQYQEMIELGNYNSGEAKELVVKMWLADEYTNTENDSIGYVEWEFFAGYENGVQPIIAKPNGGTQGRVIILSVVALVFALVTYFVYMKKFGRKRMRTKKVTE